MNSGHLVDLVRASAGTGSQWGKTRYGCTGARKAGQGGQSDMKHSFSSIVALSGASKDGRRELLVTLCVALLSECGRLAGSFPLVGILPV